ncbi:T9SS type A sorting domain-containing protein [Mucilaginibacter calamicampi]|uniref:T9SS type A sorting domain-containing protein n=1 Tax=Mucilaginibacter calamicampi TaxID=1302352 RepID=A0ABW2YW47_9SPHI
MIKKLLLNFSAVALFFGCLCCANVVVAQTVTLSAFGGGLTSTNPIVSGSHVAVFGFNVQVSGGSVTFKQYNLTSDNSSNSYLGNGILYRSPTATFSSGTPGTPVGNVIFNGTTITINNFTETITNTTNYYYLVADAISAPNTYMQVVIPYGSALATDINGNNYNTQFYSGQGYNYNGGSPYPVVIANETTDLTPSSTVITNNTTALKLFAFSVKNTSAASSTYTAFRINSNLATLSNYFTNFTLYTNTSNTFTGSTSLGTVSASGSYVNFTGLNQTITSGNSKYYWLVADCSVSGSLPVNVQFNFAYNQSSNAVTTSTPTNYNNFTASGYTYNVNSAALAMTSEQNGLAGATVYPGETGKAVFGFGLSATVGAATINQININSNNSSLSTYYGGAKLYRSTTNNYTTGSLTLLGSGSVSGAFINFTSLSESITNTAKYYFLVVDVTYSGGGTNSTAFNFTASQASVALTQTTPALTFNTFNISGNTFNITQPVVNVASNTNGLTANNSALVHGQTSLPVYGLDVAVTGATTVNSITIAANGVPTALASVFANAKLYKSSTNSYTGTLTQVGTVNFSGSNIVVTGINDSFSNTTRSYFLAVDDIYYGTSGNFQPVLTNVTTSTSMSQNIYQYYYSFAVPPPTFVLTGNNSVANGITQGALQYGQTGIVLFGFKLDVTGTTTISEFNIPSTGTANTFFNTGGTLYRSTVPNFSIGTSTVVNTAALSWQPAYVSATVSESFSTNLTPTTYYYFLVGDYNNVNASASGTIKYGFSTSPTNASIRYTGGGTSSPNNVTDGQVFNVGLTYDWVGITDNSFTTTSNYRNLNNGTVSTTPGQYDQLRVGVVAYQQASAQPTIGSNTSISKLWFGSNNSPTITLSNARTLTISGGITVSNSTTGVITGGNSNSDVIISGGTSTIPSGSTLNITNGGAFSNASILSNAGTLSVTNGATNSGTINQTGTGASTFSSTLNNTGTFNNTSSGTTTFTGTLTNSSTGIIQTSSGTLNVTAAFTNSGTFSPSGGTVNFASTFTNSGTSSPSGGTINFPNSFSNGASATYTATGGAVNFTAGGNQAISNANTTTPVTFNNLTVSTSGTKTLGGAGTFNIKSSGVVTLAGTAILAAAGKLTLKSDASGTASIAQIATGAAARVTGNVTVERYFTGGALSNRGWRLMSFPVNTAGTAVPPTSSTVSDFTSLKTNLIITGAGGSGSGWDQPGGYTANGPTILFYSNTGAGSFTIPTTFGSTTSKAGQGFYFYFRGNNTSALSKLVRTSGNFATPEAGVVGLQTGNINQQNFSYAVTATGTGYNLLGNPYPSAITVTTSALSAGTNSGFFYLYSPSGNSMGPGVTSISLSSGQGFFFKANVAGNVNFTEAMKTPTQPALLMSTSPIAQQEGAIQLQMVQDSANYDVTLLRFSNDYNENYLNTEDADDLSANGQTVFLGAMTADKKLVGTASQPLNKKRTSVSLSVNDNASGLFTLNKISLDNIPEKYDVWLKDNYKKDSLDLRANSTYNFNIDKNNAATFGDSRFEVVISVKALPPYKLIAFNGQKNSIGDNVLKWSTQNEYDYTYFELERSLDNKTFEGVNNSLSSSTGNYTFTDVSTAPVVYYRLKQTDIYDVVTYSTIVIVEQQTGGSVFSVYPNPVNDILKFEIKENVKGTITMSIYNSVGRIVRSSSHSSKTGQENVSSLLPGPYTVELIDNGSNKRLASAKFIKQ